MHPFSVVTVVIFVAGYITARWDLVTRLYELAIFAVDRGVLVSLKRTQSGNCADLCLDPHDQRVRHPLNILLPSSPTHRASGCTRDKSSTASLDQNLTKYSPGCSILAVLSTAFPPANN